MQHTEILIVGAGPTGLSAAWRLSELGHTHWRLVELASEPGGSARSVVDRWGFTWDLGLPPVTSSSACLQHCLKAWGMAPLRTTPRTTGLWMDETFTGFPCEAGQLPPSTRRDPPARTFFDWSHHHFGEAVSDAMIFPYCRKYWTVPPERLDTDWAEAGYGLIGECRTTAKNPVIHLPEKGGTGALWQAACDRLKRDNLVFNTAVTEVNSTARQVSLSNGTSLSYDYLVSTLPLDGLITRLVDLPELQHYAERFYRTATRRVGIGLRGEMPSFWRDKSWVHFPEETFPVHRISVPSNFSPYYVPGSDHWSLLCEASLPQAQPERANVLPELLVKTLRRMGWIPSSARVVCLYEQFSEYGEPVPFYGRWDLLSTLLPRLMARGIFSRGRFGTWQPEVGSQESCLLQGREVADRIVSGEEETTCLLPQRNRGPEITGPGRS